MKMFRIIASLGAVVAFAGLSAGVASADGGGQTATNESLIFQGGYASSGDAFAFYGVAKTGDAEVENEAEVEQEIEQTTKSCGCEQDAYNASLIDQWGKAKTGDAKAIFGFASSGDSEVENEAEVEQEIEQKVKSRFSFRR